MLKALDASFRGTARFELRRRIGEGAVGVVYEAFDREHRALVALKTLRTSSPESLLSLKREFRAAQNLRHENLVRLGELLEADGVWFFTMELLSGLPLTEWIRAGDALPWPGAAPDNDAARPGALPLARLQSAFRQLVSGLSVLHGVGKVHRDVKPSNVLVTSEGRVVILDFGLAIDALRDGAEDAMVGTAAYMAPEQALLEAVGPAADWYALGVVLYQALTGRLPFQGSFEQIIEKKLTTPPVPPRSLVAGVPAELDALCLELLRPDPAARPSGERIGQLLGHSLAQRSLRPTQHAFVGRSSELEALLASFRDTRKGRGVSVVVSGESGVGKSFLVRTFLDQLCIESPDALVLAGRCYERESVPYKAFDGVVDQLSQVLANMPAAASAALLPASMDLLARAFPVLEAVRPVEPATQGAVANPQEQRARVFAAMRELLTRLSRSRPLVIAIDDLQWADADSRALLSAIMRPRGEPNLLLLATRRVNSGIERSHPSMPTIPGDVRFIDLATLPYASAAELARRLLRDAGESAVDEEQVRRIVEDAQGHPLFIDELVRQRAQEHGGEVKLDEVLYRRIRRLEPAAQRALELLAVAGTPISQEAAARAAALDFAQLFDIATALRADALVRMNGASRDALLEPYHDRIRESVLGHMTEDVLRDWHLRLAGALEDAPDVDPETVASHWLGAWRPGRAAEHYLRAAEQATGAMAFERAARLYRVALEHGEFDESRQHEVRRELASALTNAGLLPAAADVRIELARAGDEVERLDQERRAAEHLMCSGHYERGLELLRSSLLRVRIPNPDSRLVLLFSILFWRLMLTLRGLELARRRADRMQHLVRADVTWSAGNAYGMSDNMRGAYFQARCLVSALDSGDPERTIRALGMAICAQSTTGPGRSKRTRQMLAREHALAAELGSPEALAYAGGAQGITHFNWGEFERAKEQLDRAEVLFRERCVGVTYELNSIRAFLFRTLFALGELRELRERALPVLNEARRHQDRYMIIICQSAAGALLATQEDQPEQADEAVRDACGRLVQGVVHLQHYWAYTADCQVALYRADAARAYAGMSRLAPALKRALLWRVMPCRMLVTALLGRAAAALSLESGQDRERLWLEAERCAARLAREGQGWGNPAASSILGSVAAARGEREAAASHFAAAARGYDAEHMKLYAAATMRLEGLLRGGDDGALRCREADARFAAEGVLNPERMTALLAGEPPRER